MSALEEAIDRIMMMSEGAEYPPQIHCHNGEWFIHVVGEGTGEFIDIGYGDSVETLVTVCNVHSRNLTDAAEEAFEKWQTWKLGRTPIETAAPIDKEGEK